MYSSSTCSYISSGKLRLAVTNLPQVAYLPAVRQAAVVIHFPLASDLRPCSQESLFGGSEGILGLRCLLLFGLLATCL